VETLKVMHGLAVEATNVFHIADSFRDPIQFDAWFRQNYRYRPENEEIVRTPARMVADFNTLGYFEGDCDDAATFYAAVIRAMGFPVRFVAIRYDPTPDFKHVFIEYKNLFDWIRLDPTVAPGTQHIEVERMVENV
jgi:hypothetical protein